ncbi:MAG: hypothetical protein OXB89_01655, partial [Anaerolineaceae bacterium]|nr:hypothetical protein [Anaerolineaceae bacterium]
IETGTFEALQDLNAVPPFELSSPVTITAEIAMAEMMEDFRGRPGLALDYDSLMVTSRANTWMEAWDQLWDWSV